MSSQPLLLVEPQELTFHIEQGRPTCTIRLTNYSGNHVAFKIRASNPNRFRPSTPCGKMHPWSYQEVIMHGQVGDLPNLLHRERFWIESLVVRPDETPESFMTRFNRQRDMVDVFDLRVAHVHQQQRNLNFIQQQDRNRRGPLETCIIVVILCFISWCLMIQILSRLWMMISAITVFVLKMMRNTAVEAAEDWIKRTLVFVCLYFLDVVRENLFDSRSREELFALCSRLLKVVSGAFLNLFWSVLGHEERRRPRYRN